MVQALFPPPTVGLVAPEAVVEGRKHMNLSANDIFAKGLLCIYGLGGNLVRQFCAFCEFVMFLGGNAHHMQASCR